MKKKIIIEGMSCEHCVKHVKAALEELNGVTGVSVSLEKQSAVLEAEESISDSSLKEAVEEAGYDVVKLETM
ncbi:heavy-metal-associated domain-containing protein [Anaeromicropila populeti]|uniref:Copper ion binding protein n=1 Tax=Anaeromicropila populeti TaxID=37658 RepID=A0A1I6J1U7_9FIRM|nr:heavy metal-associated domain-containing protein [Anaeromicropila populeti]SFR72908.1 copper ion binding protein [Anaeromicropila populeti]